MSGWGFADGSAASLYAADAVSDGGDRDHVCRGCGITGGSVVDGLCGSCWEREDDERWLAPGLRTRGVILERVRPIRWLWHRRIPLGLPSLIVGEEGIGKGTLAAWLIARATRGELEGDCTRAGERADHRRRGRLRADLGAAPHAAGADLDLLRTLDDGEYLEDLGRARDDLAATVAARAGSA